MANDRSYISEGLKEEEWSTVKCDKYDFMIAASCGVITGLIDDFLVGTPGTTNLDKFTDKSVDNFIIFLAKKKGWKPHKGNENSVKHAIAFFECKFKDPIGLVFSIFDQFKSTSNFFSDGKVISIDTSTSAFELKGNNVISKIFCGFCNWLGHLMSDIAGSSKSKGRGMGISIPFMELFEFCDFGNFRVSDERQTFAEVMTGVFQEGYDARYALAMSIPVLLEELLVRAIWVIRKRYFEKKPWNECFPSNKHADLRLMLIVANGTLCLMDGIDAAIRGFAKKSILEFFLRLNLVAWSGLVILVLKEVGIRYGPVVTKVTDGFTSEIANTFSMSEKATVQNYYKRAQQTDIDLDLLLKEFVSENENEHKSIQNEVDASCSGKNNSSEQADHSVEVAKKCDVPENRVMKSIGDVDNFFDKNRRG
jgi:hypothetical protein